MRAHPLSELTNPAALPNISTVCRYVVPKNLYHNSSSFLNYGSINFVVYVYNGQIFFVQEMQPPDRSTSLYGAHVYSTTTYTHIVHHCFRRMSCMEYLDSYNVSNQSYNLRTDLYCLTLSLTLQLHKIMEKGFHLMPMTRRNP